MLPTFYITTFWLAPIPVAAVHRLTFCFWPVYFRIKPLIIYVLLCQSVDCNADAGDPGLFYTFWFNFNFGFQMFHSRVVHKSFLTEEISKLPFFIDTRSCPLYEYWTIVQEDKGCNSRWFFSWLWNWEIEKFTWHRVENLMIKEPFTLYSDTCTFTFPSVQCVVKLIC